MVCKTPELWLFTEGRVKPLHLWFVIQWSIWFNLGDIIRSSLFCLGRLVLLLPKTYIIMCLSCVYELYDGYFLQYMQYPFTFQFYISVRLNYLHADNCLLNLGFLFTYNALWNHFFSLMLIFMVLYEETLHFAEFLISYVRRSMKFTEIGISRIIRIS